jgi:hypothetical protein
MFTSSPVLNCFLVLIARATLPGLIGAAHVLWQAQSQQSGILWAIQHLCCPLLNWEIMFDTAGLTRDLTGILRCMWVQNPSWNAGPLPLHLVPAKVYIFRGIVLSIVKESWPILVHLRVDADAVFLNRFWNVFIFHHSKRSPLSLNLLTILAHWCSRFDVV